MLGTLRRTALLTIVLGALLFGCAPEGSYRSNAPGSDPAGPFRRPPIGVELVAAFENHRTEIYFPFEGLAGVAWGEDGTLVVCDEVRGRVHSLDPRTRTWRTLDDARTRPYRPVAAIVDGFKILVLDAGGRAVHRFDLSGVYQDRIVDLVSLDPAFDAAPSAFAVDVDGSLLVTDIAEQQVLMLDSFLSLKGRVGGPGPHQEQFDRPLGICYMSDGGFMVADTGNRRLQRFNRLGYWEATIGGPFDAHNPFVAPAGLACDRWGNVFVADPVAGVVHVMDANDRPMLVIGRELTLQGSLLGPVSVAVGPDQQLAVADQLRRAVLVFRILYE